MTSIFAVVDPDTIQIRYVGTCEKRPVDYLSALKQGAQRADSSPLGHWLHELDARDRRPNLVLLKQVESDQVKSAKHKWIHLLLAGGCDLLNVKDR